MKLALFAAVLTLVPLAAVGVALIGVNQAAIEDLSKGTQLLALDDLARTIDQEFVEAADALATVGALFADPSLDDATRLAVIRAMIEGQAALDHVALYDPDGNSIVVVEEEGIGDVGLPETLDDAIRAEVDARHVATGGVSAVGGETRALVAVRIRVDGQTTGYVASAISLEDVQQRLERLAEGHFHDIEDSLYVVDRDFQLVAHVDRERAAARDVAHDGILDGVTTEMLGPSFSLSREFDSEDGTRRVGSSVGIPGRPWALVAQVPVEIAYASLQRMRIIVIGTVIVAMLMALLLGLLLARGISRPLKRLTAYAKQLASRNFDAQLDVSTSDELSILGDTMTRAAADLKASEVRIKREVEIRNDLGRYVDEKVVDQIVSREQTMELGGRRRQVTVMFADVVGFTKFTNQLAPEHVVTILNELFSILTEIVFKHGGTVDKFIGDCVMAMWGAPSDQADQARRAIEAAEDMLDWLETGNERWEEKYGVTIQLAIGVHTGEAVVGNIGSKKRMEYTGIGETVNLAARLEAVARPNQILVTDETMRRAGDGFEFVDADLHRLSGWAEPIHLWEVRV
ncbi:MAG: adenylate/guanylate cyclase domain-containing protein [Sandaracinaceae bacterium]